MDGERGDSRQEMLAELAKVGAGTKAARHEKAGFALGGEQAGGKGQKEHIDVATAVHQPGGHFGPWVLTGELEIGRVGNDVVVAKVRSNAIASGSGCEGKLIGREGVPNKIGFDNAGMDMHTVLLGSVTGSSEGSTGGLAHARVNIEAVHEEFTAGSSSNDLFYDGAEQGGRANGRVKDVGAIGERTSVLCHKAGERGGREKLPMLLPRLLA